MQSRVADRHWSELGKRFLMISFTIKRWAFLCAVLVCVAEPQLSLAQSRTPNNVSPADKRLDSVDNLNRFANGFIQAIKTGDERLFSQVFDFDGLVDREISRIKSNPEVQRGFRDGINGPKGFIRELLNGLSVGIGTEGGIKLIKFHQKDGRKRALFRILLSNGGVNYQDVVLGVDKNGNVYGEDVDLIPSLGLMSLHLRRNYLAAVAATDPGLKEKLSESDQARVEYLQEINNFAKFARERRPVRALECYFALPTVLQKQRDLLMVRLLTAQLRSESEYLAAIEDFQKWYPDDPGIHLISIDYFIMQKQYDRGLQAVEMLSKSLSPDPWLDQLRAVLYLGKKDYDSCRRWANAAIAKEPTLVDPNYALLTAALQSKSFSDIPKVLDRLEKELGIQITDPELVPEYEEFVQSREYQNWKAQRKASAAKTNDRAKTRRR